MNQFWMFVENLKYFWVSHPALGVVTEWALGFFVLYILMILVGTLIYEWNMHSPAKPKEEKRVHWRDLDKRKKLDASES